MQKEKKLLGVQSIEMDSISAAATNIEALPDEQQPNEEILEVDRLIQEKEEILNKLLDNVKGYAVLKNEFEKLVDAINNLEEEKKVLEIELEKAKKTGQTGNNTVVEKMKERFNTVKKELEKMREDRNKKEQAYKVMQRESKQCEAMQKELHKLKEAKVTLMRQQKSQYQQLQKLKKESALKISVFKKNDVKKQQQVNSLKDELKKKERILVLKEKEMGRIGMKLRACEDHITQLLKIQNRNRNKGTSSSTSVTTGGSAPNNGSNRVNLKVNPLDKYKSQLESSEFEHLITSKGLLEQVVISQVEKRLAVQSYSKKSNQLKQLNADLVLENAKLENLLAVKSSIVDEYQNSTDETSLEEDEFIHLDSLPIEVRYKLEAVQTDILFTEDVIDEISKEIDDCNIELDELSLRMEEYGIVLVNGAAPKYEENSSELNWEYIGREIVSSLSISQAQVLIMDFLADKSGLLEKCKTFESDYKKSRTDFEISSDKANKYLQHLEKLRDDFHDRLSKIEKQRINDVWAILKAHQTDTLFAATDGTTVGSAAAETAQLVAIQRASDLEKELEVVVANEESLQSKLAEKSNELDAFMKKFQTLEINLEVTKKLMDGINLSSSCFTPGASLLRDDYVQQLSTYWDQIGTPLGDRQNTLDYLLKCNEIAQARALKEAEDGLTLASTELKQRHDYLVLFSSMLGKDAVSFLPESNENQNFMENVLTTMPKIQGLSILQESLNKALTEILNKVEKVDNLKSKLLESVAEMWLELHDLPKCLQSLYHLKVDNLIPLISEKNNSSEAMMEIKCKEVSKVAKYLVEEKQTSLQELNQWDIELKKLRAQQNKITIALIALRDKILSTISELELKDSKGKNSLEALISSALQSTSPMGNEFSSQVVKKTIQVLSMKSASNPPCAIKLQDAMERVQLLLDSIKCNRNAVASQLKKFISEYVDVFGDRDVIDGSNDRQKIFSTLPGELIFKNSSLESLFTIIEDISLKLNYSRFYSVMNIKTVIKMLTAQSDDKIMDQIYLLLQKKVKEISGTNGDLQEEHGGWKLACICDEVNEELTSMSMFVEENWIQERINEVIKNWNSIPCDDLEAANTSSPISLRILAIEAFSLKSELKRLESVSDCFNELKTMDSSLIRHINELEEFEQSSKENRAKALSGNSKLLIEEEKYRKNAKKKFESITEKMVYLYAKLNALSSGAQAHSSVGMSSPPPVQCLLQESTFIEIKIDITGFSIQGQTLLKGGVSKEKVELMRLHTLAGAASSNVQVSNVAAPTVASAGSVATTVSSNQNNKRRLSNEKEEKAPPPKKEAREAAGGRSTAISSSINRKELAKPGIIKPNLQQSKQGSFKGSSQLAVVAPNFMLPEHMHSGAASVSSVAINLPPPPPQTAGIKSPKGIIGKSVFSKSQDSQKVIPDENQVFNEVFNAGPSDEELHAMLVAEGMFE